MYKHAITWRRPSVDAIRSGIDILVGTPGRIRDHLQNNKLDLSQLKHVVLDEVDQMLDMGFAEQVEEILSASYNKGNLVPDRIRSSFTFESDTTDDDGSFPLRCRGETADAAVLSHVSVLGLWRGQEIHALSVHPCGSHREEDPESRHHSRGNSEHARVFSDRSCLVRMWEILQSQDGFKEYLGHFDNDVTERVSISSVNDVRYKDNSEVNTSRRIPVDP